MRTTAETTYRELLRNVVYAETGSPEQSRALDAAWTALSEERRTAPAPAFETRTERIWRMA